MSAFVPVVPLLRNATPASTHETKTPWQLWRLRSREPGFQPAQLAERRRVTWHSKLPQSYDQAGSENSAMGWKDKVALYAQFSAEETLDALIIALKENAWSGPQKDDGIDALYAFANFDIWALTHRFFGKKMDLGQFERFKRVLVANPYDILLCDHTQETLSALHVTEDTYVSRRSFEAAGREKTIFTFSMSRAAFGGEERGKNSWMVDSIIHDTVQ